MRISDWSSDVCSSDLPLQRRVHDPLRLGEDRLQVVAALEAFAVDLVDVLGARRTRGEPAAVGNHLDAADRRVVAGRLVPHFADRGAREIVGRQLPRRGFGKSLFLLRAGGSLTRVDENPPDANGKGTSRERVE